MIQKQTKYLLIISALFGALAVIIGAFGAHALSERIPQDSLNSFKTGVSYQFYHCLAAFIALFLSINFGLKQFKWSGLCFLIGIFFFSGSIYLLTTHSITSLNMGSILGPLTPIGGLFFIAGWFLLIYGISKIPSEK